MGHSIGTKGYQVWNGPHGQGQWNEPAGALQYPQRQPFGNGPSVSSHKTAIQEVELFGFFQTADTNKDAAILVRTLNHLAASFLPLSDDELFTLVAREFGPLHGIVGRTVYLAYADFPDFKFELGFNPFDDSAARQICAAGRGKYASVMVLQTAKGFLVSCSSDGLQQAPTRVARSLARRLSDGYGFLLRED